jgi:two-component system sensor histidine kinase/response regulator
MPKFTSAAPKFPVFKKINDFWLKLIGSPLVFSLESRIFHSISICLMLLSAFYCTYNFFAGLYIGSFSAFLLCAFFSYEYYHSRFNGRRHSNVLFGFAGVIVFSVNYFANSGISGSTDLIWPAYLLLVFAISPYRQHITWLLVYLICFLLVHAVAYYYPFLVKYPFTAGKGEFIDRVTVFPLPVITIYVVIKYIRRSYDKEKRAAEERAIMVEQRNEQISLQKIELEQSNAEKTKLMSIISHDLRAPLINIQSYLELLNENELTSEERPLLEKDLLNATNNTMQMLSNLLYWSKSQMEGSSVNLVAINLLSVLENTLEMEQMQAAKKNISLTYHIDNQLAVIADVDMLQLVVRNLVSNAIKFTPHGGIINIDAQPILNECKITVSDNGKGIAPDKQQQIFAVNADPAFGTNNERGVGLGLLLCKEFIERQGGRIGFESAFGHGSSFFIFIPLSR